MFLAFVDYESELDNVVLWAVEQAMGNSRIDSRYGPLIYNIYLKSTMSVKLEHETAPIKIRRYVRQGDVLSPKLFALLIEVYLDN